MGLLLDVDTKYSKQIYGKEDSMLCIEKKNLNMFTLSILKRLGSKYNPDYYLKQKLKKPIYRETTPRILSIYEEDDNYLYLPRGQKYKLYELFPEADIQIETKTSNGHKLDISFQKELFPYQQEPVKKIMQFDMGVMKAVPGFGKTVMALYMIADKKVSTLVIVPSKEIQKQWIEQIQVFLSLPEVTSKKKPYIGVYNGSKKRLTGDIDIAIAASLANLDDKEKLLSDYGMVIVDECHHAASNTFTKVLRNVKAKYIYGFSATPKRKDGLEKIMYMFCGPLRYETNSFQIQSSYQFQQLLIPRMTTVRSMDHDISYSKLCDDLMRNEVRNYLIVKDVIKEYHLDGKIILLSERKQHLMILYEMLKHLDHHVYLLTGDNSIKERKEILDKVRMLRKDEKYILLATSKLLGEGFNLISLKTLFLVLPISDEARIEQYTGRIHRNDEGKDVVKVYDYVDVHIPMLEAMFHKRLKQYQKEGYYIQEHDQFIEVAKLMYEGQNYQSEFMKDIQAAKHEIIIMNTHYELSKIKCYFEILQEKVHQNVRLYVVMNSEAKEKDDLKQYIEGMGASIISCNRAMHFIVIDKKVIWYSDIDFFGRARKDSLSTRLDDIYLANEILQFIEGKDINEFVTKDKGML